MLVLRTLSVFACVVCVGACGGPQKEPERAPRASASASEPVSSAVANAATTATAAPHADACVPAPPEAAAFLAEVTGGSRMAFDQRPIYRSDVAQLPRFLAEIHKHYMVRSIATTASVGAHGPIFVATLLGRDTPTAPMRAYLGFLGAACAGADLTLVSAPVALGAVDATLELVEPLQKLPPPHDAPLTSVDVSMAPELTTGALAMSRAQFTNVVSFVVGAPAGKLTLSTGGSGTFGVLGRIDELSRDLPPLAGVKRREVGLGGSGWYPIDGGVAFLSVHHQELERGALCQRKDASTFGFSPPQLTLRARIDADGFTTEPARLGTAYVVAVPENQPLAAIYDDPLHRCRTGPAAAHEGYAQAKAQWLYGLFGKKEDALSRATSLGYKTGVLYATEGPVADKAGAPPSRIAATPRTGRSLECALDGRF